MSQQSVGEPVTGLVLAGGGARGAYEMGIVLGIVEALGLKESDKTPFPILCGTSIGSINASWIAAFSEKGCLDAKELTHQWTDLDLEHYVRIEPGSLMLSALARGDKGPASLLNSAPFEEFAARTPWSKVQKNFKDGVLDALVFTALELETGRTVWFSQLSEGRDFPDWRDQRRTVIPTRLSEEHVLASSAIPLVLPARKIDGRYYSDGGARFKTPLAAAIRAGAERLVVISLRNPDLDVSRQEARAKSGVAPQPLTVLSQLLGALSYDSTRYDMERLQGINQLVDTLERTLDAEQLERVQETLRQERGASWKQIPVLKFEPTFDFHEYALEKARERISSLGWRQRWFLQLMEMTGQGTALSFLFFDKAFTEELVDMGRADALARKDEICEFFRSPLS